MTQTKAETKIKIPSALYAAAGAGDLAYQELRKLSERVAGIKLRDRVSETESEMRHDVEKLREAARRQAHAVVERTQAAQERAQEIYQDLVIRGQHVVRSARGPIHVKAEIKSGEAAEAEDKPKAAPAVKRTRPAAAAK